MRRLPGGSYLRIAGRFSLSIRLIFPSVEATVTIREGGLIFRRGEKGACEWEGSGIIHRRGHLPPPSVSRCRLPDVPRVFGRRWSREEGEGISCTLSRICVLISGISKHQIGSFPAVCSGRFALDCAPSVTRAPVPGSSLRTPIEKSLRRCPLRCHGVIRMRGSARVRSIHPGKDESLALPVGKKRGRYKEIVGGFVVRDRFFETRSRVDPYPAQKRKTGLWVSREKSDVPRFP